MIDRYANVPTPIKVIAALTISTAAGVAATWLLLQALVLLIG